MQLIYVQQGEIIGNNCIWNFSKSILFLILEHFKILKNEMQCIHLTVRLNFVFWDIKAPITFIVILTIQQCIYLLETTRQFSDHLKGFVTNIPWVFSTTVTQVQSTCIMTPPLPSKIYSESMTHPLPSNIKPL